MRHHLLLAVVLSMPSMASSMAALAGQPPRPNIVIMVADDLGFSDLGCYGGEIKTPVLDQLAAEGLRFTQFYNAGRCTPSRASLLTGLYAHQAGCGYTTRNQWFKGYRGDLNQNCPTIAEVLRPAGYATYMVGKWHVTRRPRSEAEAKKHNWPLQRGFDRFFGTIRGAGSYYNPAALVRDNAFVGPDTPDFFYTDAISDAAAQFIREHDKARPFFLHVAYTAPHWPLHADPRDIAKYQGVYDDGWDAIRAARRRRMIQMGIIDDAWPRPPRDEKAPPWKSVKKLKDWNIRCMEVYAAMVDCMDQGVGRIVAALRESGQDANTLILFLSDNGGSAEEIGRTDRIPVAPSLVRPKAPGEPEWRTIPVCTRDGKPVQLGAGVMPGPADTFIAYGLPWANVSNTPFRQYKGWAYEGGISSPLIVHWPQGLERSRRGQLVHEAGHVIDLMATCVDLADAESPQEIDGRKMVPLQGVSLRGVFNRLPLNRRRPLYWEYEGNRAVRYGKWKLVAEGVRGPWELYDLSADRTELNNLADKFPRRVRLMAAAWEAWAIKAKVKPWPHGPNRS